MQTTRIRISKQEKYDRIDYARVNCTCKIIKRIMRGFWLKFPLICRSARSTHWVVSYYNRFLNDSIAQSVRNIWFLSRWFTMTGPTEASIVYLTSDFSWERSIKKFTAVPQLDSSLIKTPLNLEWALIRSRIAATNDCNNLGFGSGTNSPINNYSANRSTFCQRNEINRYSVFNIKRKKAKVRIEFFELC